MSTASARILRFPDVRDRVGLCKMQVLRLEKKGEFPKRIQLGPRAVGWLESEIDAWIAKKSQQRA